MKDRINLKIFIPDTASIKQFREVIFWGKQCPDFSILDDGDDYFIRPDVRGIAFSLYLKKEYLLDVQKELISCNGEVIVTEELDDPITLILDAYKHL